MAASASVSRSGLFADRRIAVQNNETERTALFPRAATDLYRLKLVWSVAM